jgi:hypothetical protein
MMKIEPYSMGVGDRFAHQGKAQLSALQKAGERGIVVVPVWNKSFREHSIIHSEPASVRKEADSAVRETGWKHGYYVDADHIGMKNVDFFVDASNFFTLDVADAIKEKASETDVSAFVTRCEKYWGALSIPGIAEPLAITRDRVRAIAETYLFAIQEAGRIYRHVANRKGEGTFVTEVSMDETNEPQTPVDMLFILAAIAAEGIPAQTVAPKFTGRFNKGVDYVGDVSQFAREFEQDLAVIAWAIKEFGLSSNLKLSVHSGSDKFSIYEPIRKAVQKFRTGLHLKTAGTTWLEELIGLAIAGGDGLEIAKTVYERAYGRFDELCGPYASVIDIRRDALPKPDAVKGWNGARFADALRHNPACPLFDPNLRQLLHVGYKVAVELGDAYLGALKKHEAIIAQNVEENILERHVLRVFPGKDA